MQLPEYEKVVFVLNSLSQNNARNVFTFQSLALVPFQKHFWFKKSVMCKVFLVSKVLMWPIVLHNIILCNFVVFRGFCKVSCLILISLDLNFRFSSSAETINVSNIVALIDSHRGKSECCKSGERSGQSIISPLPIHQADRQLVV